MLAGTLARGLIACILEESTAATTYGELGTSTICMESQLEYVCILVANAIASAGYPNPYSLGSSASADLSLHSASGWGTCDGGSAYAQSSSSSGASKHKADLNGSLEERSDLKQTAPPHEQTC